jgi:hypothetical protein
MSQSTTLLSKVLADVASAVVAAQQALDREADKAPAVSSLAPLAFVVRETQLSLLGQLSMPAGGAAAPDQAVLTFAKVDRVQAGLYGNVGLALTSRVSVSVRSIEPEHAGQG